MKAGLLPTNRTFAPNPMTTKSQSFTPETIGRTFNRTRYEVHSRRIGGDGQWFGSIGKYETIDKAKSAIAEVSKPILGGMVSFEGGKREQYEYRIVRVESVCTVEHIETRSI